jgi:hypothetical protein
MSWRRSRCWASRDEAEARAMRLLTRISLGPRRAISRPPVGRAWQVAIVRARHGANLLLDKSPGARSRTRLRVLNIVRPGIRDDHARRPRWAFAGVASRSAFSMMDSHGRAAGSDFQRPQEERTRAFLGGSSRQGG